MPGTVTVCCKLPHGLVLQLEEAKSVTLNTIYGPVEKTQWFRTGKTIKLKGYEHLRDRAPNVTIRDTFALTHGVDADFFEEWLKRNKDYEPVARGLIYASAKTADVEAHARTFRDEACGFEPTDPKNLPAEFGRRVETATSAA